MIPRWTGEEVAEANPSSRTIRVVSIPLSFLFIISCYQYFLSHSWCFFNMLCTYIVNVYLLHLDTNVVICFMVGWYTDFGSSYGNVGGSSGRGASSGGRNRPRSGNQGDRNTSIYIYPKISLTRSVSPHKNIFLAKTFILKVNNLRVNAVRRV